MHELNLKGLKFPLIPKDVKKFERQNPTIGVNILQWTGNHALPLQVTEYRDRLHHVNLLLLRDNKTSKSHYTRVRDLARLVFGRTKARSKARVCPYCLYCFTYQNLLKNHIPECSIHPVQKIIFPEPKDNEDDDFDILRFKNIRRTLPVPFAFYCDFESFLIPVKDDDSTSNTKARELHQPSGFACLDVAQVPEHNGKLFTYSDDNVMTVFYEFFKDQENYIREVLSEKLHMKQLSPEELIRHAASKQCTQCDTVYSKKNLNVRHHDHETRAYLGPYCNKCNLQLQHPRGRVSVKDRKQRKNAKKEKFADKPTRNKFQ